MGRCSNNSLKASSPPAEAPMPTMGKAWACLAPAGCACGPRTVDAASFCGFSRLICCTCGLSTMAAVSEGLPRLAARGREPARSDAPIAPEASLYPDGELLLFRTCAFFCPFFMFMAHVLKLPLSLQQHKLTFPSPLTKLHLRGEQATSKKVRPSSAFSPRLFHRKERRERKEEQALPSLCSLRSLRLKKMRFLLVCHWTTTG